MFMAMFTIKWQFFPILGLLHNFVCYTFYISLLPLILFSEKFQIFTRSSAEDAMLLCFFIIKIFQCKLGPDFRYKKTHFAMLYKELFDNKVVWRNNRVLKLGTHIIHGVRHVICKFGWISTIRYKMTHIYIFFKPIM